MGFVCQDRARALVKLGHEVRVLTTGHQVGAITRDDQGVEVCYMACTPIEYSREYASECAAFCWDYQPDVIHTESFDVKHPWVTHERHGCPTARTAVTMHGFCWGAYLTKLNLWMRGVTKDFPEVDRAGTEREREILKRYDTVINISLHEQWLMTNLLGISAAKLVYNPIADYFFENIATLPAGPKKFLCAAVNGRKERGFDIAEAAAKEAGVELIIASKVPRNLMPTVIDSCHGLILPTAYAQGMDLAVGESLIRRRWVYATSTGSYQREAEIGGIYDGAIKLFPLNGQGLSTALVDSPSSDYWLGWCQVATQRHRPDIHAKLWLEAILG